MKTYRNLTFIETAKSLGTSNVKLLELLRKEKIVFLHERRNIPYQKYLDKGWFEITIINVKNGDFDALLPNVKITKRGYDSIKNLLLENPEFIKNYNKLTFPEFVKKNVLEIIEKKFGIVKFKEEWIKRNTCRFNAKDSDDFEIFTYVEGKKETILKYNAREFKIYERPEIS